MVCIFSYFECSISIELQADEEYAGEPDSWDETIFALIMP